MTTELDRFLSLYENVAQATNDWIVATPPDLLDWIPDESDGSLCMDGRGRLSVKTYYIHLVVGDHVQAPQLAQCEEGAKLSPFNAELAERLEQSDDLIGEAMALHDQDMAHFRSISPEQMEKTVYRGDYSWSVAGYLWSIYSHRAFHVGNMDSYLRELRVKPPAYYPSIQL